MAHRLQKLKKNHQEQREEESTYTQNNQQANQPPYFSSQTTSQYPTSHQTHQGNQLGNQNTQQSNYNQQQSTHHLQNQVQQSRAKNVPRPVHPSLAHIPRHDKNAYRKGDMAFPAADSLYNSQNNYDAGADFIRPTSAIMQSGSRRFQFPLGAWIQPFGSSQVHTVKIASPLRCQRCKAYINPYFKMDPTMKTSVCNICGIKFQIPETAEKNNFNNNQISTEGVIDFQVTDKFYMRKKRDVIKVIIAIEMTLSMLQTGIFGSVIQSVRSALEGMEFESNIRIGIVYYNDDGVTFIKLRAKKSVQGQEAPQEEDNRPPIQFKVNTKTGTYCCPLSDKQYMFNPSNPEQSQNLLKILDYVNSKSEAYYKKGRLVHSANYVSTLKCIQQSFENQTGRVLLFSLLDPRQPPCAVKVRNEEQSKTPLKPLNLDYYQVAKELLASRIGVDHYIFGKDALVQHQISTTHFLSSLTGGNLYLYCPYNPQNNGEHLYYNIYKNLTKQYVYDVDFTCRVSNGLTVGEFLMADGAKQVRDVALSIMDPAHSFGITFNHEEKIEDSSAAYIQFAMMYTTGNGQRRIRIINYRYQLSDKVDAIHSACDYLAFANIMARKYASKLRKGTESVKVREEFHTKLVNIMAEYKQEGGNASKYNQLAVHPNLAPALAYLHSIFNSRLFLNSAKMSSDYANVEIVRISTLGFYQFALRYYPHLYSLNTDIYSVDEDSPMPGDFLEEDEDIAILPANLPLNKQTFVAKGVFMYNTGDYIILLVMEGADSQVLTDLFDTQDWEKIESQGLPQLETSHNIRVNNMIAELRRRSSEKNGIYQPLLIRTPIKQGPFNDLVMSCLKQDCSELNYFNFLDSFHRAVQMKGK